MEKTEVVDDGVEVKVEILGPARNFHASYFPGGVWAEHDDSLCFVRVFSKVLHDVLGV